MSPREQSIAIREDTDYVDENGSLKDFSKDVWKASCKWQRRMRARQEQTILKLGEAMEVSQTDETQLYCEDDYNQGRATVDDEDAYEGTDSNIIDVLSQEIQAKYEGMQKELDEKDDRHQEEKKRMLEIHERELELQRQALGK